MNIYKVLNEITLYIDNNLSQEIDYQHIAKMLGVNVFTMQRLFSIIAGIPIGEYIRKRKLSCAAFDLYQNKMRVMDVAIKYGYENATSFSRSFENFHGIKPSKINKTTKLKEYPRIIFEEIERINLDIQYEIIELPELTLYENSIATSNETISAYAPAFFEDCSKMYEEKYGHINYGMVTYEDVERYKCIKYSILYDKKVDGFNKVVIPKHRWLKFEIPCQNAEDIQKMSKLFYEEFLPSCKYNLSDLPELEYYHDDITDFLVPIE